MNKFTGGQGDHEQRRWEGFWWRAFRRFLAESHRNDRQTPSEPHFNTEQVIAYLKLQKKRGKPAWQRLQIVDSIAAHREQLIDTGPLSFDEVRTKLAAASREEAIRDAILNSETCPIP